jgi:hypothetical protein
MPDHSLHKAGDLARDERLLEREILRREIVTQAQEIGSRAKDANEKDVDELLDEAYSTVRGRRG